VENGRRFTRNCKINTIDLTKYFVWRFFILFWPFQHDYASLFQSVCMKSKRRSAKSAEKFVSHAIEANGYDYGVTCAIVLCVRRRHHYARRGSLIKARQNGRDSMKYVLILRGCLFYGRSDTRYTDALRCKSRRRRLPDESVCARTRCGGGYDVMLHNTHYKSDRPHCLMTLRKHFLIIYIYIYIYTHILLFRTLSVWHSRQTVLSTIHIMYFIGDNWILFA